MAAVGWLGGAVLRVGDVDEARLGGDEGQEGVVLLEGDAGDELGVVAQADEGGEAGLLEGFQEAVVDAGAVAEAGAVGGEGEAGDDGKLDVLGLADGEDLGGLENAVGAFDEVAFEEGPDVATLLLVPGGDAEGLVGLHEEAVQALGGELVADAEVGGDQVACLVGAAEEMDAGKDEAGDVLNVRIRVRGVGGGAFDAGFLAECGLDDAGVDGHGRVAPWLSMSHL